MLRSIMLAAVVGFAASTSAKADAEADRAFASELTRYLKCTSAAPEKRMCRLVYRGLNINTQRDGDTWKVGVLSVPIGFLLTVIESRCVTVHDVRTHPPRFADLSLASGLLYTSRQECIDDADV